MENSFTIGNVLGTGFKTWFKNLPAFFLITLVVYTPLVIWGVVATTGNQHQITAFVRYHGLADALLNLFASAAITYGVVMELQGQHASLGASFATGLARFFPVLGVAILSTICVLGGTLLLIVPGLIVFCMLYVATPCAVLERPGIMGALRRSRELTKGYKLQIFGLVLLVAMIAGGIQFVLQELLVHGDMEQPELMDLGTLERYVYVQLALNVITGSLGAVMSAVSYYYLRLEKEGTSAAELAAIFD
jgi:uncharacterized membrane protein